MAWEDYKNESTETLIEYIKWNNDPSYIEASQDAFQVFCFRFQTQLIKKLIPVCNRWEKDKDFAIELAYKIFDRFRQYPKSFDKVKCKKEIDTCVVLYLLSFAQYLLCDFKRDEEKQINSPYNGDEEIIREFPVINEEDYNLERLRDIKRIHNIIDKALSRFSPKHKVIYLTYKAYEKDGFKLPRSLLKSMRDELDLTQSTMRVYKKEAFEQVDIHLKLYGSK